MMASRSSVNTRGLGMVLRVVRQVARAGVVDAQLDGRLVAHAQLVEEAPQEYSLLSGATSDRERCGRSNTIYYSTLMMPGRSPLETRVQLTHLRYVTISAFCWQLLRSLPALSTLGSIP